MKNYLLIIIALLCHVTCYLSAAPVITGVTAVDGSSGCANSGVITVNATGTGTLFYAVKKTTDAAYSAKQTSNVFERLESGDYKVMVYDDSGFTESAGTYTIKNKDNVSPYRITAPPIVSTTMISCTETGKITINADWGMKPYTFRILSGPTSKPDIVTQKSSDVSFEQLSTGIYNVSASDNCGTTFYLNNIHVYSNSWGNTNFGVFELGGPTTYTGSGCAVSFTRQYAHVLLVTDTGDTLYRYDSGREMPADSRIKARLEYPAGSGLYTGWGTLANYTLPSTYKPSQTAYRIQMQNYCKESNVVTSPVYHLIYPFDWRRTVCGYELFRQIPGYLCGNVILTLESKANPAQKHTFTWNGSGDYHTLDFSGVPAGDYRTSVTVAGASDTYPTADLTLGQGGYSDLGVTADVYNYPVSRGCNFTTGDIRVTNLPPSNTVPVTFTMLSGPVVRTPVTTAQNRTLWSNLPQGTYRIRIDRGSCGVNEIDVTVQPPFRGFDATLSYTAGYMCGLYKITGRGWYINADGSVNSSPDADYGVFIFSASGVQIGTAVVSANSNAAFESAIDVPPGTYRVVFTGPGPTAASCPYVEKEFTIAAPAPLTIDAATSGGLVCSDGKGTLHIGIAGGNGQPVSYRIRSASSTSENDYTLYQSSPDFNVSEGLYTVQITNGCESDSRNLSLTKGAVTSRIDVTGTGCQRSDVTIDLRVIGQISDIKWTRPGGDELSGASIKIRNLTPAVAGKYRVTFTSGGCVWKDSVMLDVRPKPEFSFTPDTTACQAVNLSGLKLVAGDISGLTRTYFDNSNQPVPDPATVGTGAYHIVGATEFGCTDTAAVAVTVNPVATPAIITADPMNICAGAVFTMKAKALKTAGIVNPVIRWYADQTSTEVLRTDTIYTPGARTVAAVTAYTWYASVSGDNYCENAPGNRKAVTVTIQPKPTLKIQPTGDINNLCHNSTIGLNAVFTGGKSIWQEWYLSTGAAGTFAPSADVLNVVYNPNISEAGGTSKIYVRVRDEVCGYMADTIRLRVVPLPAVRKFELTAQPLGFQEMCVDTVYEVKIKATETGDLRGLKVKFHDYNATSIAIKDAYIKKVPFVSEDDKILLTDFSTDITGKTWTLPDPLLRGDSLLLQIKVAAECGFYSGAKMALNLNAESVCGDKLNEITIYSDTTYNTKQDTAKLNTYEITGNFSPPAVNNNTGDEVTWHLEAVVHGDQPTDGSKEGLYVLIPKGLNIIPGSYKPLLNAPPANTMTWDTNEFGMEYVLPMVSGLREGEKIIAELKFKATDAPCKDYYFYAEVVFSDSVDCGGVRCGFHSTRGGYYPELKVERYQFSLSGNIYGQTVNNLWSGNIGVRTETQFYAGQQIYIDFYVDRNGNMKCDDTEPTEFLKSFTYITENMPPQTPFTVSFTDVPVESQKQLLARVHGNVLCSEAVIPVAVLTGVDTVCETDTALYHTVPGMQIYKWLVDKPIDAVSGATPVRIPLEGSTVENYINESTARVVWKKRGDYEVWTQYSLPGDPPHEISKTYFPVRVNERPVVALTGRSDTTVCRGSTVELSRFFKETTGIGALRFHRVESNGSLTFLSDQTPFRVTPSDTTVYRVTATCLPTGCTSNNFIDFTINVATMPQTGSVSVVTQPGCMTAAGSIRVIIMGGSGSYVYRLNDGTADIDLPADGIIGNLRAGDYRVYVKNKIWGGCSSSISEAIKLTPVSSGLNASAQITDASSCSVADGSVQITVNGGMPPYRYRVNDDDYAALPANGMIGTDFAAGKYNVTIFDATNCSVTPGEVHVKATSGFNLSVAQTTPAACAGEGAANITISGGQMPYAYRLGGKGWAVISGTSTNIALAAGTHEIFARDAAGCETSAVVNIANTSGLFVTLAGVTNVSCNGNGTGSVRLNIGGGSNLKYSIDGGATFTSATAGTITVPGLKPGVYRVLLVDGAGCRTELEGIRVGEDADFVQAVDNRVYTYMNRSVSGQLSYDDYDFNRQGLNVIGYSAAKRGWIDIRTDGYFSYLPGTDYAGKDSVQYSIANPCGFISTAWLYIHVLDTTVTANRPPIAMDDDYIIQAGQTLSGFDVTKNDTDPDGDALTPPTAITNVLRGELPQNGNGTFTYTPNPNFVGVDIFMYRICDNKGLCSSAQVHITVLPAEVFDNEIIAMPDAYSILQYDTLKITTYSGGILGNDVYPQNIVSKINIVDAVTNGDLDINDDGTFTYTPDLDYAGFDGFTYALCAADLSVPCDTARVSIFVAQRPCTLLHGTYTVGSVAGADFATLKAAADNYNNCGISTDSRLVIVSDITETETAEFLGMAPGSAVHTLTIVSDGTRRTIGGSINGPLVKLTGANNIIIDGANAATEADPSAPLLSFVNTYAMSNANVTALRAGKNGAASGKHVRIRHAEFSLAQQSTVAGVYAAGFYTDSVFVQGCYFRHANIGLYVSGNKHADIRDNIVTAVESQGIYVTPASPAKLDIVHNIAKDFTSAGFRNHMSGIRVDAPSSSGQWNITGNRVSNLVNNGNFENYIEGIKINGGAANITSNNNIAENLTNGALSQGFSLYGMSVSAYGSLQMTNDTVRNLTSESFTIAFDIRNSNPTSGTATVKKCFAGNINGKGISSNLFNSIGMYISGHIVLDANTVTGIRNTAGSSIGIRMTGNNSHYSFNNMVSDVVGRPSIGISVSASSPSLYQNTVRLTSKLNDTDEATVIDVGDRTALNSANVRLSNNIFSNEVPNGKDRNFIIKQQQGATINNMPTANNRYRVINGNVAMIVADKTAQTGNGYPKLSAWANATTDNSMLASPSFKSATDLHLAENTPSLHVPIIASVAADFDGDPRTSCRNAAGADNFTAAPAFTFSQPTVTYANCKAKAAFETTGGVPAFYYSLDGTANKTAVVDSFTMSGNRAVHFDVDPIVAGTHLLALRDANNCTFMPSTASFTLATYPAPTITAPENACEADRVLFTAEPSTGSNYLWSVLPDGLIEEASVAHQKYYTWTADGTKTVSVTVTDPNGCVRSAQKTITIYPKPEPGPTYRVPNTP